MRPVLDSYLVAIPQEPDSRQGCHECGFAHAELDVDAAAAQVAKYAGLVNAMGPKQVAAAVLLAAMGGGPK